MTRQVSLAEATYDRLRRHKRQGESFSDTIERLLDQEKEPMRFADHVPRSPVSRSEWLERIEADREATRVRL